MKVKSLSRVRPLATPWTAAYQAPLSMGVSRQEYWSGVPLPSPSKTMKSIHLGMEEIKLFVSDMMFYVKNMKEGTKQLEVNKQ